MDEDHDGVVQSKDLVRTYKELYPLEDAEERVREVTARMDANRAGLNYTEFLRMTMDRKEVLNRENLRKAFQMFDGDGNGYVTSEEVREWLDDGLHMDPGVIDELIRQMDKDGDGRLVLQDFEDLLEGYKEESSPL
jgi:Ca2+-binding EF-hand superfamily protein